MQKAKMRRVIRPHEEDKVMGKFTIVMRSEGC